MDNHSKASGSDQGTVLTKRDWGEVERQFAQTSPFHYAVLDDFFSPAALESFRGALIGHWGWNFINWNARELFIRNFEHPLLQGLIGELKTQPPEVLAGTECVSNLAFLYIRNEGLHPHSDLASITVNTWMTPNEFNLEEGRGGLVLHDVRRTDDMMVHEFNAAPYCVEYFEQRTHGRNVVIPYRFNRTVIFDSRTFHSSDQVCFRNSNMESTRMNFGLSFDDPVQYRDRFAPYEYKLYRPGASLRAPSAKQGA